MEELTEEQWKEYKRFEEIIMSKAEELGFTTDDLRALKKSQPFRNNRR